MSDSEILTVLYNNFDPNSPATREFYVDCTDVRGGNVFAAKLCDELAMANRYQHILFTGHIGGGKSSELQHLADEINLRTQPATRRRFLPVIVQTKDYLDSFDVRREEILLAIVTELAAELKDREGLELKDNYFQDRLNEMKNLLLSDLEIHELEVPLFAAKAKIQGLKSSASARDEVRQRLRKDAGRIVDAVNEVFVKARKMLEKHTPRDKGQPYTDFLLIVDGLDRVLRYEERSSFDDSQKAIFVEDATTLMALNAYCVFTAPLSLCRAEAGKMIELYGRVPHLLPMIKTEKRGQQHDPYTDGRNRLKTILQKRLPEGVLLNQVFQDNTLDFLVRYSGGHVRSLLRFAREATASSEKTLPLPLKAAHRAIAETVTAFSTMLQSEDWMLLAELEASSTQKWDGENPAKRDLLEQVAVQEYINGGEEDPFNEPAPWYAVNPILREMNPFNEALRHLSNPGKSLLSE
jgi:signal transduction histidine kinase